MYKTIIKSNITKEHSQEIKEKIIEQYPKLEKEINQIIQDIKKEISRINPIELLTYLCFTSKEAIQKTLYSNNNDLSLLGRSRALEYVQSLYASKNFSHKDISHPAKEGALEQIVTKIEELYLKIYDFCIAWACLFDETHPEIEEREKELFVLSQKCSLSLEVLDINVIIKSFYNCLLITIMIPY